MQHDFLADGIQWERTPDYHFYMLYCVSRIAWISQRLGVNLWNKEWFTPADDEGFKVIHPDFEVQGAKKLRDYFIAPMYLAQSDYSLPGIGDSAPRKVFEVSPWGPMYEIAWGYEPDERFAWLLTHQYRSLQEKQGLDYFPRGQGDPRFIMPYHFLFVQREELPEAHFDLGRDARFCLNGRHEKGCTLFPSAGFAVMRADTADSQAHSVTVIYGPHHAGHQHPDLLSFTWNCDGQAALRDTALSNYDDRLHGAWVNQTAAHNTVLVDGLSHNPQGDSDGMWWTHPGPGAPAGQLLDLVTSDLVKAVSVQTNNAYDFPVTLRRSLVLTKEYLWDSFECWSEDSSVHQWDYALQFSDYVQSSLSLSPVDEAMSEHHGLRELAQLQAAELNGGDLEMVWSNYRARFWCSSKGKLFVGSNPMLETNPGSTCLIRQIGSRAEYSGLFTSGRSPLEVQKSATGVLISGPDFDDNLTLSGNTWRWIRHRAGRTDEKVLNLPERRT